MFSETGYSNPNFILDVSNFDTSNVTGMERMFNQTGYNSIKLNTSITIRNSNIKSYSSIFSGFVIQPGSQMMVNYTSATSDVVDKMMETGSICVEYDYVDRCEYYGSCECLEYAYSNVIKGNLIVE
jgi:hypothetical protein